MYTWSQIIPENKLSIRAIIDNNMCPIAYVDNKEVEEINHSSIIYLIGPEGKYVTHFIADLNSDESQSDKILAEIKKYVI